MSKQPFYVGQKVICIKDHSEGLIKRHQVFTVGGVKIGVCKHCPWVINIGICGDTRRFEGCAVCYKIRPVEDIFLWFSSTLFAPYNPPRHENVEIAADLLVKPVEERADVLPEKIEI